MRRSVANILAIETSGTSCSVALNCGGELFQILEDAPREHARKVLGFVDDLLRQSSVGLVDIDAIAFAKGPGSFTGLRIGFGIVQGLAFGSDCPVIGISTLQAMAFQIARVQGLQKSIVVPALDARMNEVYFGIYTVGSDALPAVLVEDSAMTPDVARDFIPREIGAAIGDGWIHLSRGGISIDHFAADFTLEAKSLALMAMPLFEKGAAVDINAVELAYIRNEISWKKRQRIRVSSNRQGILK